MNARVTRIKVGKKKMEEEKFVACKKKKIGNVFEIECKRGEKTEKMYCIFGQKGESGGISGLGFGGQYGKDKLTFECFSQSEIDDKIARKLGIKKECIKWIDE